MMPTLELTNEQVIKLVNQLPSDQQELLFKSLLIKRWETWVNLSHYGEERVRIAVAQRGQNWDTMTEDEREVFIDDLIHEDRQCNG
jgi:hypothetical protein